jgi:hypothetical protein
VGTGRGDAGAVGAHRDQPVAGRRARRQDGRLPARLGGRARYHLPGTRWYATAGARTTFIYRRDGRVVVEGQPYRTQDLQLIARRLETLAADRTGAQPDETDA